MNNKDVLKKIRDGQTLQPDIGESTRVEVASFLQFKRLSFRRLDLETGKEELTKPNFSGLLFDKDKVRLCTNPKDERNYGIVIELGESRFTFKMGSRFYLDNSVLAFTHTFDSDPRSPKVKVFEARK